MSVKTTFLPVGQAGADFKKQQEKTILRCKSAPTTAGQGRVTPKNQILCATAD